jgi:hypothetical protein
MSYRNLVLILLVIVIIGGIWYVFSGYRNNGISIQNAPTGLTATTSDTTGTGTTGTGTAQTVPVPETVGIGSLQNLMAMNSNLTCSVNLPTASAGRSGTVYVSSSLLRADFFSTTGSQTEVASMIDNGTSLYLWMNGSAQGIKLSAPVSASDLNISQNGGINPSTNLNYVCHPWAVNAAFFVPPSTVTFSATAS